ncbi:MAG: ABC transporter substrate-binding protein, partial [Microcoleaceae cyanobacterium]
YKLTEYGTDVLRFEPFAQYWGEKPQNLGVDIRIFSSAVNLFNAFKTGEIDIAYLSLDPQQIETLKKEAATQGWQAIATDSKTVNYMVLNVKSPPLDKPEVRQALAAVLNRSLIINRVLQNQAEPVYSTVLPQFDVYQPVFEQLYGKDGNITKAQELLTQAGFSATNPAVIEIWYPSSSSKRGLTGNTLKAIADKELGGMMQLKLNSVEATTAYQNLEKGVYQTFLLDWYGDYFDPDAYIQPFLYCSKGSEATGCEEGASKSQGSFYYNAQVNQLIDDQRRELDPVKRKAIFQELQNFLGKDVPYIPFWLDKDYVFAQKNITGVKVEPSQQFPWWSIQKN